MKSVLISIKPKWCELIANGKKTVEVRKTKPKIETPFKCYIYMTAGDAVYPVSINGAPYTCSNVGGKVVIGEFVCDNIDEFSVPYPAYFSEIDSKTESIIKSACLTPMQVHGYNGVHTTYAWHISDLVIYDKPMELSEFRSYNCRAYIDENSYPMPTHEITRPPQSWCYVEERSRP
jgi:predicted transcriptional regulator